MAPASSSSGIRTSRTSSGAPGATSAAARQVSGRAPPLTIDPQAAASAWSFRQSMRNVIIVRCRRQAEVAVDFDELDALEDRHALPVFSERWGDRSTTFAPLSEQRQ